MVSALLFREEVREVVAEVLLLLVMSSSSVRLDCLLLNPFSASHALCTATGDAERRSDGGEVVCVRGIGVSETLGARQWHKR